MTSVNDPRTCTACGATLSADRMRDDDAWSCVRGSWNAIPRPRKKVIYLDTFALSHMYSCLVRGQPGPWAQVYGALELAVREQAIVCPRSWHHALELALTPQASEIAQLTEPLTGGLEFRHHRDIQRFQTEVAFENWLAGKPVDESVLEVSTGFDRSPNEWATDERTCLVQPDRRHAEVLEARRSAKHAHKNSYVALNARRQDSNITFEEILSEERAALGSLIWRAYASHQRRYCDMFLNGKLDEQVVIDADEHAMCFPWSASRKKNWA